MGGLPLVGIDDFVYWSDFINEKLGSEGKAKLLESVAYRYRYFAIHLSFANSANIFCREKFVNFLDVRHRRLLLSPDNAITRKFVDYLMNSTSTYSVQLANTYHSKGETNANEFH